MRAWVRGFGIFGAWVRRGLDIGPVTLKSGSGLGNRGRDFEIGHETLKSGPGLGNRGRDFEIGPDTLKSGLTL